MPVVNGGHDEDWPPPSPASSGGGKNAAATSRQGQAKESETARRRNRAGAAAVGPKVAADAKTSGTRGERPPSAPVPAFSASASKPPPGRSSPPPPPPPSSSLVPGSSSLRKPSAQPPRNNDTRTPATRGGGTRTRSALKGPAERVAVMGTPVRKAAAAAAAGAGGEGGAGIPHQTPRQAAIAAKKELTEQKRRKAAMLKQQELEMKNIAKAKQAELAAEQQRTLRERAERAKKQRLAAASAKKAAKEKQTEKQARALQEKMDEQRELNERLAKEERARRRESLAYRSAAWEREREMKKSQRKARKQEQRLVMEGHELFREAKSRVKKQQERTDKQERAWRANRAYLDKSLDEGAEDKRAYEAYDARMDRYQDQAALDRAEEEERRLRRTSAQWGRNKQLLDREIERGSGKALDPFKLADELFQRAESRQEDAEYREAQKALWRASQQRRRRSEARRKVVGEALQEEEREREADLTASKEEGMRDVEAYRQECLRRDRESLDWHRQKFFDDRAVEEWTRGIAKAAEAEDRELSEFARLDCEAYKHRVEETQKLEEEYRRQQQIEGRFYKEDEELRRREQEAEERRRKLIFGQEITTLGSSLDAAAEAGMRAMANDRALKHLGHRELNLGSLPPGAKIVNLPNQVGGHKMMKSVPALLLLEWEGKGKGGGSARFVLKILHDGGRGLVELGFYENLARHAEGPGAQGKEPERTELASFLCPYFGAVKVMTDGHTEEDGEVVEPTCMYFLVLEDLCNGLDNPCALDVKMGRVTVEPGEREEKKIGQLRKYPNQPMVGFRYVGMSWSSFFEGDQVPEKISENKKWGAGMAVEDTGGGLARFFYDGTRLRRGRVKCALRKIRAVRDFFARQKIFKFYASSLLLTYDSADPALPGDVEEEVAVCMIDFAHAVPVDGDGELGEGPAEAPGDKGYLYGAENLVGIMEELLEVTAEEPDAPMELSAISAKLQFMANLKKNYVADA